MFQSITPLTSISNNFKLVYPGSFYVPGGAEESVITSTPFKFGGIDNYFADTAIPNSSNRKIFAYKLVGSTKVTTINDCGVVNPSEGTITLNSFIPDDTTAIRINVTPDSLDIAPKRDEILSIDSTRTTMTADKDTIATSGSSGSINYSTTSRFRSST